MKKIIYTTLILVSVLISVSSCTEEEVKPAASKTSVGGGTTMESEVG